MAAGFAERAALVSQTAFASHRAKLVVNCNTRKLSCAENGKLRLCSNEEVVWKRGNMGTRPISAGSSAHDQCTLKKSTQDGGRRPVD